MKQENVEPIVLEDIILYGMNGKPVGTYKRIELDGEAVRGVDGEYLIKSQDDWSKYFSDINDGRRLPTAANVYAIIERLHETGNPALAGIVKDLEQSWLCTGTKVYFQKNTIIHPEFGAIECPIPSRNRWADKAVKTKPWKDAIQALLMCENVDKAIRVLHEVSGKRPFIWMPSAEDRRYKLEVGVWLDAKTGRDRLYLYCDHSPLDRLIGDHTARSYYNVYYYGGRARGVRL